MAVYKNLVAILNSFIGLIFASAFCFLLTFYFAKPVLPHRTDYIAPPEILKNLSFGQTVQLSDSFWLRAVQDFEYCENPLKQTECSGKSWLFKVLNLSVNLDKTFFEAHYYGALALTIIISDYAGASAIFDQAVERFPKKWPLLYAAGYHAIIEEKNKSKAAKLYHEAAVNGAPDWVRMMAGKFAADAGDISFAEDILKGMIAINKEPAYIKRLQEKLAKVKKAPK